MGVLTTLVIDWYGGQVREQYIKMALEMYKVTCFFKSNFHFHTNECDRQLATSRIQEKQEITIFNYDLAVY